MESLYCSLTIFAKHKDNLLCDIHENLCMNYGRDTSNKRYCGKLKKANVDLLEMNRYKAVYYDEIPKELDECIGTNLGKKYLSLSEIKK